MTHLRFDQPGKAASLSANGSNRLQPLEPARDGASENSNYIIFLSAHGERVEHVAGFEVRADARLVKPSNPRDLLQRIQAVLGPDTEQGLGASALVRFGRLEIDCDTCRVRVDGEEIELTRIEFELLHTLYLQRNRIQTREMLLDKVWDMQAHLITRTVDTHVTRLRNKLGEVGNYVKTLRGVGYGFIRSPEEAERQNFQESARKTGRGPARSHEHA